ncbi:MAG TPA: heme lyase CcmF/NrfE family subunit [Caulobacteraceae bacterium]|jgi:cytochrome c-type biogenesis protein CcmF
MIAELGAFALMLALGFSLVQFAAGAAGRARRDPALSGVSEGAALTAFLSILLAFVALMSAFVRSDFSVANVAANSHTAKPLFYKVAAVWGSHEGSMLLWNLALTGFGAAVALGRGLPRDLKTTAVAVQGALGVLFIGYTALASSPFARLDPAPIEGRSLNPVLQDPFLAIHPPFLYLGYVGCSVVFSFALAALIEGRVDAAWARWVRPWTLAAWSLLTVGITLGSYWAYYELGWGGWWFWDPVENASFMPWLVATALLHSAAVTEKRNALAAWTVLLAIAAFGFSMLGAFLVRSGVLTSVHAFALDPTRGSLLLAILIGALGTGFALYAWRAPKLQPGGLFAPISREGALVLNNVLLSTAAATVLVGTLYPLIREAFTGEPISVGPPYFNLTFTPLMAICLLLTPLGPLLAWKRGDALGALQRLWAAGLIALAAFALVLFLQEPRKLFAAAGIALGFWLIAGSLAEVAERTRLGRVSPEEVGRRFKGLPRGAWGMTLAHLGLGVFVLGACFETSWKAEASAALRPSASMAVAGFDLRLEGVREVQEANYSAQRAAITVTRNGAPVCQAAPERRLFLAGGQNTSEVAICQRGLDDIYLVMGEPRAGAEQGLWVIRAYFNPWARLIFLGPLLMAIGGLISLSDRRLRFAVPQRSRQTPAASPLPVSASSG